MIKNMLSYNILKMSLIKYPNYNRIIKSIFEFNSIRLQKFLHMIQDMLITSILCFSLGIMINKLFKIKKDEQDKVLESTNTLIIKTLIHISVLMILIYYIRKITKLIPFFLRFNNKYDPFHVSSDGESLLGKSITLGMLFSGSQTNLFKRLSELRTRF